MDGRTEHREYFGHLYPVFIYEYEGSEYRFDPVAHAQKEAGIAKLEPKHLKSLGKEILEHMKVGKQRAYLGAVLQYIREKAFKGEPVCPAILPLALLNRQRLY